MILIIIIILTNLYVKVQELILQLFLILIACFHQDFKMNLNLKILQIKVNNYNPEPKNQRENYQQILFKLKMSCQSLNRLKTNEWKKIIH